MKFNATFNNISAILWRSVLLVKETRRLGWGEGEAIELSQVTDKLYHIKFAKNDASLYCFVFCE